MSARFGSQKFGKKWLLLKLARALLRHILCLLILDTMMDALLQTFWIVVGASLGIVLGISKEGADFVASLGSAQGWKQIYTGYTPKKMKKLDNGDSRHGTWKAAPVSGVVYLSCTSEQSVFDSLLTIRMETSGQLRSIGGKIRP